MLCQNKSHNMIGSLGFLVTYYKQFWMVTQKSEINGKRELLFCVIFGTFGHHLVTIPFNGEYATKHYCPEYWKLHMKIVSIVTISKSHNTIIPWCRAWSAIFIAVFATTNEDLEKNAIRAY